MDFKDLNKQVIHSGLCTGCGMCAGICPTGGVQMVYVDHELEPALTGKCTACSLCFDVCPGKDVNLPKLDKMVFGRRRRDDEVLGVVNQSFASHATDTQIRAESASGGVTTALMIYALEQGLIDAAMLAHMDPAYPTHTLPKVATSREDVIACEQSIYQVAAVNACLSEALHTKGVKSFAHIGLGCQIHAMRKMQMLYPTHRASKALAFSVGLFCFSNFYTMGSDLYIQERFGVGLDQVARLEYRGGRGLGAFRVTTKDGQVLSMPYGELVGQLLQRFFRRERCAMCTDYTAELADISLGDYFGSKIPEPGEDLGWNTILVRTEKGKKIIEDAQAKGYITLTTTLPHYVALGGGQYNKKTVSVHNMIKRKRYGWPVPDYHTPLLIKPVRRDIPWGPARPPTQ